MGQGRGVSKKRETILFQGQSDLEFMVCSADEIKKYTGKKESLDSQSVDPHQLTGKRIKK